MKIYQIAKHPLVREFIHRLFSLTLQRPFVYKVLCLFLSHSIADKFFNACSEFYNIDLSIESTKNLIDSIETCLNSRNSVEALELMSQFYSLLYDSGYHHEFVSLACRILDSIDWKKEAIAELYKKPNF